MPHRLLVGRTEMKGAVGSLTVGPVVVRVSMFAGGGTDSASSP